MSQIVRDWITVFVLVIIVLVFALSSAAIFPRMNAELGDRQAVEDMGAADQYDSIDGTFTIILYVVLGGSFLYGLFAAFRTESVWRRL